jgi:hypothetical protein
MQQYADVAIAGLRLKSTPEDVRSMPMTGAGTVSDATAVCDAGNGEQCAAPDGTLRPVGIVVFQNIGKSGKGADGREAYQQYDVVPVMRVGRIWVKPTAVITATGGKVYVRTANADSTHPIGSLQPSATDGTELVGATWDSISNADGLAIVQLRGA